MVYRLKKEEKKQLKKENDLFSELCKGIEFHETEFLFKHKKKQKHNFKSFNGTPKIFIMGFSNVFKIYLGDYLSKMSDADLKLFKAIGKYPGCLARVVLEETDENSKIKNLMPLVTLVAYLAPIRVQATGRMEVDSDHYTGYSIVTSQYSPTEMELLYMHVLLKAKDEQFDLSAAENLIVKEEHVHYHRILATVSMRSENGINRYEKRYMPKYSFRPHFYASPRYKKYFQHIFK